MKHFLYTLSSWWFAALTPVVSGSLNTIDARETWRKRRLLSLMLATTLFLLVSLLLLNSMNGFGGAAQVIQGAGICVVMLLALWINRRGDLRSAGLLYVLALFFYFAIAIWNSTWSLPSSLLCTWCFFLIIPTAAALFLPPWAPIVLTLCADVFTFWFMLTQAHSLLGIFIPQPAYQYGFYTIIFVITITIAIISTIWTITSRKAIIQADRADELEMAHQQLDTAYKRMEVAHHHLEEAHTTIQKQALTDGLTGLPNHRALMEQLQREEERALRYGHPFALLFFDADRFKRVNDTYGHAAGDTVLRQIGERASRALHGGDLLGRFGGEEFLVLLPETDAQEAAIVAERIRAEVAACPIALSEKEEVTATVSIGLSTFPADGNSQHELLQQADAAMYVAKRMGRNQVRTAEEMRQLGKDAELMLLLQQEGQQETAQREEPSAEQLRESYTMRMISSLVSVLQSRDGQLKSHAYAVRDLATSIAEHMRLDHKMVVRIGMAALLHDIGKVGVPDRFLRKTEPLSPEEWTLLQDHVQVGTEILSASPFLGDLVPGVRHHHERWDGTGYPDHLKARQIPLEARIIAVAETYDFMQRKTDYQEGCSPQEALNELCRCAGTQFDPVVVQALSEALTNRQPQSRVPQAIG